MKMIPLTQGYEALIDDADCESVNVFKWHAAKRGRTIYARRNLSCKEGKRGMQYLHSFLMPGVLIDHRDGDGLNNQRHNLRPATLQQNNQAFKRKRAGASSQFRGVSWEPRDKKWEVHIKANGKQKYLGRFKNEEDAARAYDIAAREHFGEYASPNFPL